MAATRREQRHAPGAGASPFPTKDRRIGLVAPPSPRCYVQTAPRRVSEASLFYGPPSQKLGTSPPSKSSSGSRTLLPPPISRLFSPLYSPPPIKATGHPREDSNILVENFQNVRPTRSIAVYHYPVLPVTAMVSRTHRS